MSDAAASGGGMKGSGDDNGGDKKGKGKAMAENLYSPLSSDEEEAAEVDGCKTNRRSILDLASLQASLPMKRGLSSHYDGRSKSFGNLSELGLQSTKDLGKKEHAINKRRRLLLAHELYEKSGNSSTTMSHTSSLPTFFTSHIKNQDEDEDEDDDNNDNNHQHGK